MSLYCFHLAPVESAFALPLSLPAALYGILPSKVLQTSRLHLSPHFSPLLPSEYRCSYFVSFLLQINHIQTLCLLLDVHFAEYNVTADTPKEEYEMFFVFCCIWAFGAPLLQGGSQDNRSEFSKWWQAEWKQVQFPQTPSSVFDYYVDKETRSLLPWSNKVPKFELCSDIPLQATLVHIPETIRLRYFMDIFLEQRLPLMLVGSAGSGKTVMIRDKLASLSDSFAVATIPLNFYTTSG